MSQGLYLGRQVDPASGVLGARVALDPADLVTHGLIVGMTGSGKTGLAITLIEEVLRQGIPVLAIDPKGDLGNLLLLFDRFDGDSFLPWIDRDAARRDGKDPRTAAAETAVAWERGLAEWGLGPDDARALLASREAVIFTPGSRSGVPLDVLHALEASPPSFDEDEEEDLRDEIASIVSGLLGLLKLPADPHQSTEAVFLATLVETSWRAGKGLSLEALVAAVAEPPMEKIGALSLESVYPRKERQKLMLALNNLVASPSFGVWREGEPLDVQSLLWTGDGRPRLSIVYTAHLSDEERLFVTALVLNKVKGWTRRQTGTSKLRALVYMDEVFGYFPPHPADPPTKRPLLTLLKQARAQGVGVVLSTQNPVDLDYKALANMGLWAVGTLQTQRDRERLMEGLTGVGLEASAVETLLDATRKRVFLLHDIHRDGPTLVHSRFALSFLRGPLTREDVVSLTNATRPGPEAASQEKADAVSAAPAVPGPPPPPAPFRNNFLRRFGGELADPFLFARFAVRYKGEAETILTRAWPIAGATAAEILDSEAMEIDLEDIASEPPAGIRYADLPGFFVAAGGKGVERALRDRLPDKLAVTIQQDPVSGESSRPGESLEAFILRLTASGGGAAAEKLRQKLEKKQKELETRQGELRSRSQEKWGAIAGAVLGNLGLLTGRKRTVSGVGGVLAKNRMENSTESKVEALQAEVATLAEQLAALSVVDPERFSSSTLQPPKSGVKLLRFDLVWVY